MVIDGGDLGCTALLLRLNRELRALPPGTPSRSRSPRQTSSGAGGAAAVNEVSRRVARKTSGLEQLIQLARSEVPFQFRAAVVYVGDE